MSENTALEAGARGKDAPREEDEFSSGSDSEAELSDTERFYRSAKGQRALHLEDFESDDEAPENTIGNVPIRWYDQYDHIGYDVFGDKIARPPNKDALDEMLSRRDDPTYKWTLYDEKNGKEFTVSNRELDIIKNIQSGHFPHPEFNAFTEYDDAYSSETSQVPITDSNVLKSSFVPPKWEQLKVNKLARAIKEGRISLEKVKPKKEIYLMWEEGEEAKRRRGPPPLSAPKPPLPGHAESYNPPAEYLWTAEEKERYEEDGTAPSNFEPQKYSALRKVPGYANFVRERFERCLDLYLAPRTLKKRVHLKPDQLLPTLPDSKDLRPFPNEQVLTYPGATSRVRTMSVDPTGTFLATGCEDGLVRVYEVLTTKLLKSWDFKTIVHKIEWNPDRDLPYFAVALDDVALLCDPGVIGGSTRERVQALLKKPERFEQRDRSKVEWHFSHSFPECVMIVLHHKFPVRNLAWHHKGDYLATVCPSGSSACVSIHQISQKRSQMPFRKNKGEIQCVSFHPSQPFFFVANKTHVRVYNLVQHIMMKKLRTGAKHISSLAVHPSGDHLILGRYITCCASSLASYDKKVIWFDLDMSSQPFKTLRYHKMAVRQVVFHPSYPLMASASDDSTVHIFHSMVYGDFMKDPLIVPVKVLRGHEAILDVGVMDAVFHPTQPWIFTCGADHSVRLFHSV